jgi:hypothetical protein
MVSYHPEAYGRSRRSQHGRRRPPPWKKPAWKLVMMDPRKFLRVVDPCFTAHRRDTIDWLTRQAQAGTCFAPLQAWPKRREMLKEYCAQPIMAHEGRHRAWVASRLGVERVPVLIWNELPLSRRERKRRRR